MTAQSQPVGYTDLIKGDPFQTMADKADMVLAHFVKLENGIKAAVKPLGEKLKSNVTNVKELKDQSAAIDKISAAEKAQINVLQEKERIQKRILDYKSAMKKADKDESDARKKAETEQKKANAQTREEIALAKANKTIIDSEKGSYNSLSAQLTIVSIKWKKLSEDQRLNSKEGKELTAQKLDLTNKLKSLDAATGVHVRNVGNYTGAIIKLQKGLGGLAGLLGTVGGLFGLDTEKMQMLVESSHELIKTSKELHHVTELNEVAETAHTEAVVENTGAEELHNAALAETATATEASTAASEGLTTATEAQTVAQEELNVAEEANPIMWIVLAIAALGAALYGLNAWMTSSSDETKKLAIENAKLNKEYEESKLILDRKIQVQESELDLLKAQHAPLETIRKKEHEINAEKEKALLNNIATIKSNINLDVSKLNDIKANDSIYESLLRVAEQTERGLGFTKEADATEKLIQYNKSERAKEVIEDANKQLDALAKAQADWNSLKADELKQDADITDQEVSNSEKRKKKLEDEAKANQELMDAEADRIVAEMEQQNKLDVDMLSDKEQAISKLKDQRDSDATDRQKELNDGLITKEQYDADILSLDTKLAADIAELNQKETDAVTKAQQEQTDAVLAALQKQADAWQDAIDARNQRYEDELTQIKDLTAAFGKGLDTRTKAQEDALATQTAQIDSELQTQATLFAAGMDNNLAEEKKARAEATEEGLALQRKAAKEKKAMELAETYISFIQSALKSGDDPKKAAREGLAETLVVEGIADAIAGNYAEGIEDFRGKGTSTSDSNVIGFSDHESVVTAKGTQETKGLVTAVNKHGFEGAVDWAMKNIYAPNFAGSVASDNVGGNGNADYSLMLALNTTIETSIAKGFSKIPITNWSKDAVGRLIQKEIKNGLQKTINHSADTHPFKGWD